RRQLLGSCNLEGRPIFHLLTGNLSFQIEQHLFPDLPSNRYAEIAPQVRAVGPYGTILRENKSPSPRCREGCHRVVRAPRQAVRTEPLDKPAGRASTADRGGRCTGSPGGCSKVGP